MISRRGFVGAAAATAVASPLRAQERPDLTIAVQQNPATLEPAREIGNVGFRVLYNVFDTLIMVDWRNGERLIPGLAESWRRIDGRTVEYRLKAGIRFHNGDELTAEDVAFTFSNERMGPGTPLHGPSRSMLGNLAGVQVVDPRTVRIVMQTDDPTIELLTSAWTTQIVSRRGWREAGSLEAWYMRPIGTGPYRVRSYRMNEDLILDAFDEYWGGRPNVRSVRLRVVPDLASRVNALLAGQVDMITDVSPDQIPVIEARPNLEVVGGPIKNHRVICWEQNHPVLRDPRVRRALSLAIDRQAIVDGLWAGRVTIPRSHQWEEFGPLYIADRPPLRFDPSAARSLLRDAGYSGQSIPMRTTNIYYTNELATSQLLAEMWRAVGINVELQVRENFAQTVDRTRGIWNWSNTALYPDPVSAIWRLYGAQSPVQLTWQSWTNAEFNELGRALVGNLDPAVRRRAFARMLDIYDHDDPPGTVLHRFGMFYGKRRAVQWEPLGNEYMDLRPGNLGMPRTG